MFAITLYLSVQQREDIYRDVCNHPVYVRSSRSTCILRRLLSPCICPSVRSSHSTCMLRRFLSPYGSSSVTFACTCILRRLLSSRVFRPSESTCILKRLVYSMSVRRSQSTCLLRRLQSPCVCTSVTEYMHVKTFAITLWQFVCHFCMYIETFSYYHPVPFVRQTVHAY